MRTYLPPYACILVINSIEIKNALYISEDLTDKSSLGKIRDCYPLKLF